VVTGASGPEAGVWVIAETSDLPTGYAKMVVTDDQGPLRAAGSAEGQYKVWVRGYGPDRFAPRPTASRANSSICAPCRRRTRRAAAQYYPAIYWFSMLNDSAASEFGGSGDIPKNITRERTGSGR